MYFPISCVMRFICADAFFIAPYTDKPRRSFGPSWPDVLRGGSPGCRSPPCSILIFAPPQKSRWRSIMATINLRDFYPWYTHDEFVDVPDIVAEELFADRRYQKAHRQRMKRNKAYYSLDAGDGIENSAIHVDLSPHEVMEYKHRFCRLCCALNSLPETQGRRVEAHYILGKSITDIAKAEGVSKSSVSESISAGLRSMKKYLQNLL